MKHNKLNIIPGDVVILDEGFNNSCIVRVVYITPLGMYSKVHLNELNNPSDDDSWEVMTNRLSLLKS